MKKVLMFMMIIFLAATAAKAAAPGNIRYQGTLKYKGQLVEGSKAVRFRITSADGSASYWDSGSVTVTASNGVFSYQLNPATVDWNNRPAGGYFLEVSVEGLVLLPREEVLSNIYSLHAKDVDDGVITEPKLSPAVQVKLNAVGSGDNLGNHIATTTLNMSGYDISNAGKVAVSSFTMASGAVNGYFLRSDASGNASWQSLGVLPGDNLGDHTATTNLNMSNKNIINVSGISVSTVSFSDGTVLMSTAGISPSSLLHSTNTWTARQDFSDISANSINAASDIKTGISSVYYLGDPTANGTWRFLISGGGGLIFQKRVGGVWVTQAEMSE